MSKLYNTQGDISTNLFTFFYNLTPFSKPILNNLSKIIVALTVGESAVTHDIAKNIKDDSPAKHESVIKRIRRFLNNPLFNINSFYDLFIRKIIYNYKISHNDLRVHIIFDHVFILKKWTILVFSLRIGRQSIPLWFKCFKKIPKEAFTLELFKEGIDYCKNLFCDKFVNLIYLGDRGFFNVKLFKYFDSIGITYCIRIKGDTIFRSTHGKKKSHTMYLNQVDVNLHHSKYFNNAYLTNEGYRCNLAISRTIILEKGIELDDIWYVATNANPLKAIREYSYRFGAIETVFKNMKTNGFYLEKTAIKNLIAFNTLFGIICISLTWLTIIGTDLTKNKKNKLIGATKKINGKFVRILSLFNAGLTWFHKCLYTTNPVYKLNYNFILYDT